MSFLRASQVPFHDLFKDALCAGVDGLAVARYQAIKVPRVNPGHALVEAATIRGAEPVPDQPLLPFGGSFSGLKGAEKLGESSRGW